MKIGLTPLIRVNLYSMLGRKRFMKAILRYKCSRKGTFQTNLTGGKKKEWSPLLSSKGLVGHAGLLPRQESLRVTTPSKLENKSRYLSNSCLTALTEKALEVTNAKVATCRRLLNLLSKVL